jgi:hypothetical protein
MCVGDSASTFAYFPYHLFSVNQNHLRSSLFWDVTQGRFVIYRRFAVTLSVPSSNVLHFKKNSCTAWPLKRGPKRYGETSITNYLSTLRNIQEEGISHLRCGGSLKSPQIT